MMKKFRNLFKVVACLAVCFTVFIGNPIKTDAGWWSCFMGNHRIVTTSDRGTCQSHPSSTSYCADCGQVFWIQIDYTRSGPHYYSTDPYKKPVCKLCGKSKY